jgi:hypothetical protein
MIRVLALIAVVGFVMSVACLSAAAAIGGRDAAEHGWDFPEHWNIHVDDNDYDSDDADDEDGAASASGPQTTREIAWDGSSGLDLSVPAEVRYTQGSGPAKLTVTGPKGAVDHVVLDHGQLRFDEPMSHAPRLQVVMTAPNVSRFALNGDDRLSITGYRQPRLAIDLAGSGQVNAEGAAQAFDLQISGSGTADLSRLTAEDGKVDLAGSGHAKVAPKGSADVQISGSGDVTLLGKPQTLRSAVSGSGKIIQGEAVG